MLWATIFLPTSSSFPLRYIALKRPLDTQSKNTLAIYFPLNPEKVMKLPLPFSFFHGGRESNLLLHRFLYVGSYGFSTLSYRCISSGRNFVNRSNLRVGRYQHTNFFQLHYSHFYRVAALPYSGSRLCPVFALLHLHFSPSRAESPQCAKLHTRGYSADSLLYIDRIYTEKRWRQRAAVRAPRDLNFVHSDSKFVAAFPPGEDSSEPAGALHNPVPGENDAFPEAKSEAFGALSIFFPPKPTDTSLKNGSHTHTLGLQRLLRRVEGPHKLGPLYKKLIVLHDDAFDSTQLIGSEEEKPGIAKISSPCHIEITGDTVRLEFPNSLHPVYRKLVDSYLGMEEENDPNTFISDTDSPIASEDSLSSGFSASMRTALSQDGDDSKRIAAVDPKCAADANGYVEFSEETDKKLYTPSFSTLITEEENPEKRIFDSNPQTSRSASIRSQFIGRIQQDDKITGEFSFRSNEDWNALNAADTPGNTSNEQHKDNSTLKSSYSTGQTDWSREVEPQKSGFGAVGETPIVDVLNRDFCGAGATIVFDKRKFIEMLRFAVAYNTSQIEQQRNSGYLDAGTSSIEVDVEGMPSDLPAKNSASNGSANV